MGPVTPFSYQKVTDEIITKQMQAINLRKFSFMNSYL